MKKTERIEKARWRKRDGGREGGYIPGLRLIQGVKVLTESGYDTLILVGVLPEYVLQTTEQYS